MINAFVVAFFVKDATLNVLHIILFVLTVALAFVRVKELFFEEVSSLEEVWSGIKLTILTLAVIHGYTILFDEGAAYMLSLICMVTAITVFSGFTMIWKNRSLFSE